MLKGTKKITPNIVEAEYTVLLKRNEVQRATQGYANVRTKEVSPEVVEVTYTKLYELSSVEKILNIHKTMRDNFKMAVDLLEVLPENNPAKRQTAKMYEAHKGMTEQLEAVSKSAGWMK